MPSSTRIPLEVWLEIFRHAVQSGENAFDTPLRFRFDQREPPNRDSPYRQLRPTISTKRTLVLVSRTWNCLAERLLYEDITLDQRYTQLAQLSNVLVQRKAAGGDGRPAVGRFVKRLALKFPLAVWGWTRQMEQAFIDIGACCPNLILFEDSAHGIADTDIPPGLLVSAFRPCAASLRSMRWSVSSGIPLVDLFATLGLMTHLEVLCLRPFGLSLPHSPSSIRSATVTVHLPRLHTLEIDDSRFYGAAAVYAATWDLPCLKRVILHIEKNTMEVPFPLLETHGWRVTSLEIVGRPSLSDLRYILERCRSVEELTCDSFALHLLDVPLRVRRLALGGFDEDDDPAKVALLLKAVRNMRAETPLLTHIRMYDFVLDDHAEFRERYWIQWNEWLQFWRSTWEVLVEDCFGFPYDLLPEPKSDSNSAPDAESVEESDADDDWDLQPA
ncbi:hypothetical protein BOTBODRAFT_582639 [Botryobasidium botryosum FD-172 SS1]|uniref:F-box domain-containing protein n=1 Tax=Botryobasidium botryosum (strain FD-172 SS1) TaxID=930990 RepID=A0A067MPU9_BOTB1|nr:hypothetical protein BOTBODRAFT_582639 [Botryobasidium botryosum FD-172 SS1]